MIIFDLDDTLVETSKALTPLKLKDALHAMIEQGLAVPSEEEALAVLLKMDRDSPNGKETLQRFIRQKKQDPKFVEVGAKVYYGSSGNVAVDAVPGASEVLAALHRHHELALVSTGVPEEQYRKMKSAHLNTAVFSSIIITEEYDKKPIYTKLLHEKRSIPSQSIVCGDKFKTDLAPAQELGMKTVHFMNGRGARIPADSGAADYVISRLSELIPIVDTLTLS